MVDTIEKFNKLKQTGSVRVYLPRFEELRSFMIYHNPHLSEAYFVSSITSGLSEETTNGQNHEAKDNGASL